MPSRARLGGHPRGKVGLAAGQALGQDNRGIIGRVGDDRKDEIAHRKRLAGLQTEIRRGLRGGMTRNDKLLIEREFSVLEAAEHEI